jgi:hypothetical protein
VSANPTRKIRGALLAKGFQQDATHHEMYWLVVKGLKLPVHTNLSHGIRDYGSTLLGMMARELRLRRSELNDRMSSWLD